METNCSCADKIPLSKLSWLRRPPVHVFVACDPKRSVRHRRIDPNLGSNGHLERDTQITLPYRKEIRIVSCIYLFVCLSVCQSVCLSACCLFVYRCVRPAARPCVLLSVRPSVSRCRLLIFLPASDLTFCLSVHLFVCLSAFCTDNTEFISRRTRGSFTIDHWRWNWICNN